MKKVLLVDDDKDFRETLKFYLLQKEYLVDAAESSEEAFTKLKSNIPDIILLDVMLPGMSGNEMCKKLKADPVLSSVPVIMLTVKKGRKDIENAMKTKADGYMSKPFDLHRLIERIEELTSKPSEKKSKKETK